MQAAYRQIGSTRRRAEFKTSLPVLATLALALAANVVLGAEGTGTRDPRPNIVFAFADDWGRYASAYAALEPGGPSDLVQTPNFDRVAREGVLFTHAFVNAPSCTPCRSSILSGQYFWRTGLGAILQGAIWDDSIPSYPLLLRDSGYHIGHTYKVWSPGTPRDAPYGGSQYAYTKRGGHLNSYSQFVSAAKDRQAAKKQVIEEVRGNFRDFLAQREGRPFCYWFGPTNTHRKWIQGSGKDLWGLDPDGLKGKLPEYLPDVPIVREDFCDYLGEAQAFDMSVGILLEELEQIGQLDNTIIVISGDHGIPGFPRGKCNLYDLGVGVALAIRWPQRVPAGRVVEDFVCLPDLAPTFLDAAGLTPPEGMTARSLLSILTSDKQGTVEADRDHVIVGRERHVAAARDGQLPYPQRAIRTKDFLYIRNFAPDRWPMGLAPGFGRPEGDWPEYEALREDTFVAMADMDASPTKAWIAVHRDDEGMEKYMEFAFGRRPAEELYDLRHDPHHMKNAAGAPEYAAKRKELAERLLSVLKETGDPRVTGDGSAFDQPPYAGAAKTR